MSHVYVWDIGKVSSVRKIIFLYWHDNVCVAAKFFQETQTAKKNLDDNNRSLCDSFIHSSVNVCEAPIKQNWNSINI